MLNNIYDVINANTFIILNQTNHQNIINYKLSLSKYIKKKHDCVIVIKAKIFMYNFYKFHQH